MSLALSLITWDSGIMYLLFGGIFLLSWIYSKTLSTLTGTIKENVKFVIAKDLAVSINSFFLLMGTSKNYFFHNIDESKSLKFISTNFSNLN